MIGNPLDILLGLEPDTEAVDDRFDGDVEPALGTTRTQNLWTKRVSREANLLALFPERIEPGTGYHFITAGDIDQLSFLAAIIRRHGPFAETWLSTWTMSREDVLMIDMWANEGSLGRISFFTGEYFNRRETAVYATLLDTLKKHNGRIRSFKNHAKLILARNEAGDHLVVAGSANFTMNPRTEQACVHNDLGLFEFYTAWLEETFKAKVREKDKYTQRYDYTEGNTQ